MRQLSLFDPIQMPLSKGQSTLIDPIDADLMDGRWYVYRWESKRYVIGHIKGDSAHSEQRLHRIILGRKLGRKLLAEEIVDHIDGDSLNNCRSNLRLASRTENACNVKRHKDNTSGYKGVSRDKKSKMWKARIFVNGKDIALGVFINPADAHKAYCDAAVKYHGEFARFE